MCCRFCDLVNSIAEETWKGSEEGECDADALEVREERGIFSLYGVSNRINLISRMCRV